MRKMTQYVIVMVLLAALTTASSGCIPLIVGAAAGAGAIAYVKGILEMNFDKPVEKVHAASLKGLKDSGIIVLSDEVTKHAAVIKGTLDTGEDFRIDIEALTEHSSKLKIRVGMLGDEAKSQMILNAIVKRL